MPTRSPKLPGELGSKISLQDRRQKNGNRQQRHDPLKLYNAEFNNRLGLLLKHYGIPTDTADYWYHLCVRVLMDFVPGFGILEKPGAKKLWSQEVLSRLRAKVDAIVAATGVSARKASGQLLKLPDGSWRYARCRTIDTIYRRYLEAKAAGL